MHCGPRSQVFMPPYSMSLSPRNRALYSSVIGIMLVEWNSDIDNSLKTKYSITFEKNAIKFHLYSHGILGLNIYSILGTNPQMQLRWRGAKLTLTATLVLRQQASGGKDTLVPCGVQINPPSADTAATWRLSWETTAKKRGSSVVSMCTRWTELWTPFNTRIALNIWMCPSTFKPNV